MSTVKCVETRKETNRNIIIEDFGLQSIIYDNIHNVIGKRYTAEMRFAKDKKAMDAYNNLEQTLFDLMSENYTKMGYEFNPEIYMRDVIEYIRKSTGDYFEGILLRNSRTLIQMSSRIISDVNEQRRHHAKGEVASIKTFLLPIDISSRKSDRYGIMSNLASIGRRLIEIKHGATTAILDKIEGNYKKYESTLGNQLFTLETITEEYTMGGIDVRIQLDKRWSEILAKFMNIENISEAVVEFVGSRRTKEGNMFHKFRTKPGEKDDIYDKYGVRTEKGEFELPEDFLSTKKIRGIINDAYSNQLMNKLGSGQTRYVEWHNPAEHLDKSDNRKADNYDKEVEQVTNIVKRAAIKYKNKFSSSEFHYITVGGITYRYVMIKQPEGRSEGEVYRAFIISHKTADGQEQFYYNPTFETNKKSRLRAAALYGGKLHNPSEIGLDNGFFTSDVQKEFGNYITWDKELETFITSDIVEKVFADFHRMPVQPHDKLIVHKPYDSGPVVHGDLWETLAEYRNINKTVATKIKTMVTEQHQFLMRMLGGNGPLLKQMLSKVLKKEDSDNVINMLTQLSHINSRVYVAKDGTIYTPDSTFETRLQNYWPMIFEDRVIYKQLENIITKLDNEIENADESTDVDKLTEQRNAFEEMYKLKAGIYDDNNELKTKATLAQRTAHLKHRAPWTDATQRRLDGNVMSNYVERTFNNLNDNSYMNIVIDGIYKLAKTGVEEGHLPMGYIESIINRVRINTGDPMQQVTAMPILSPSNFSKALNKFKLFGTDWTASDVMRMVTNIRSTVTHGLLRTATALINRTQIINPMITVGLHGWDKVLDKMNDPAYQYIVKRSGVTEPTNHFEAFLTGGGGKITMKDMGSFMLPGARIPIPTRTFTDFLAMGFRNRRKAIENGIPHVDVALEEAELARVERAKDIGVRIQQKQEMLKNTGKTWQRARLNAILKVLIREQKRTSSETKKRDIEALRENFLDFALTPKNNRKYNLMKAKIIKIHGSLQKERSGRMTEWSLGYWPDWMGKIKSYTTLMKGEEEMRRMAALAVLLNHYDCNLLGNKTDMRDVEVVNKHGNKVMARVPSAMLSQDAINLMQDAVANTMFGMTARSLGESFAGVGGIFSIFKSYTMHQMIHDYEVLQSYRKSGKLIESLGPRLIKAANDLAKLHAVGNIYDPSKGGIDHEAVRMLRLTVYRLAATTAYELLRSIGLVRAVSKFLPQSQNVLTMARNMESPLLGLPMRMAIRSLIYLLWGEDDNEKLEKDAWDYGEALAKLFLPVVLTYPIFAYENIKNTVVNVAEWFD